MDHKKDSDEQETPERTPLWYKLRRAERLRGDYPKPRLWVIVAVVVLCAALVSAFVLFNR